AVRGEPPKKETAQPTSAKRSRAIPWSEAEHALHRHSRDLFGSKPKLRHIYIMVTAPSAADIDVTWVRQQLELGTNIIRINCAHDTAREWQAMVTAIREESRSLDVE